MIPVYDDGDDNTYMIIKYVGYARLWYVYINVCLELKFKTNWWLSFKQTIILYLIF